MAEASVVINGITLTNAQAMALRVAVTAFHSEMSAPDALGDDEHGRFMTKAYHERLTEVLSFIIPAL